MAVGTAIALGSAVLGAGTGIAGAISQGKQARNYQKQMQNYQRQTLVNPYAGLQVSTLGADRQIEDLARTMTTYGNLAAMSGTRGIASLLPNLTQAQNDQTAKIAANLDEQQKQIDQLKAQGEMQIQGMTEQRENNDLLGLGQAYQTARAQEQQGINQIAQSVGMLGYAAGNGLFDGMSQKNLDPYGFKSMTVLPGATVERIQTNPLQTSLNTKNNGVLNVNPFMQSIYRDWQLNNNSF